MACWMQVPSSVRQLIQKAVIYCELCTNAVLRCGLRTQMCYSAG
jgi:predicted Zn-dependent protease